ncbi:MAG: O-antigen ligase family protein [Myxococcota bacterium]
MRIPGPFAHFILFLFIPITAIIFAQHKPRKAAFIVVIWGTMLLPEKAAFDPPILPAMDKHLIAPACAFVGLYMTAKSRFEKMRLLRGIQSFFFILVVGNFGTALTNPESFMWGGKEAWPGGPVYPIVIVPPLPQKEMIAMSITDFITFVAPFAVGQMLIQSREEAILFLRGFVIGCLVYVPAMLWEGIMSPQLHRQLYGYHATGFAHNMRGDGYKPTVFMQSGLGVAMFEFIGLCGAMTMHRIKEKITPQISGAMATGIILFALSVSRNVAVVVYAAGVIPVFLFTSAKMMMRAAFVLAMIFLSFPLTRAQGWFPVDDIIELAESYSEDRAGSLAFRFENEDILIEHTREKPIWGWGSYGRNRKYDPDSGKDISVTDGEWAIHYSMRGGLGVIGWFWMASFSILAAWRKLGKVRDPTDRILMGAMALTAAINAADLLPNSSFTKLPFVYAGALAGLVAAIMRQQAEDDRGGPRRQPAGVPGAVGMPPPGGLGPPPGVAPPGMPPPGGLGPPPGPPYAR